MIIKRYRRYNRLQIINNDAGKNAHGRRLVCCLCNCGVEKVILFDNLKRGLTKSCGCLSKEVSAINGRNCTTHGMTGTRSYHTWEGMLQRCLNLRASNYYNYGARGVTVCERWHTFENFYEDMGERPEGKTLDRFPDNDGDYEPNNCRWATPEEQYSNKRNTIFVSYKRQRISLIDAIKQHGVFPYSEYSRRLVYKRIKCYGWSVERAITQDLPLKSISK